MSHYQRITYEGYLGANPEMRYAPSGTAVTNFRVGSTRSYKNSAGDAIKETTWLRVTAWGKLAEIVNQYCEKGTHVLIEGILRPNEYGNPTVYETKNGTHASSYEITANVVRILTEKRAEESEEHEPDAPSSIDDEIPF